MALLRSAVLHAPAIVATLLLVLPAHSPAAEELSLGKSAIKLNIDGTAIEAFTYKPPDWPGKRMLLVLHGAGRNAEEYRDHAVGMADRFGALIVAPHFDDERFPSSRYQRGGLLRENGSVAPANEWTYSLIPKLAHAVREREDRPDLCFWIIGHSAGGQFSMRMSAFVATGAERIVAANPGSALLPRL